MIKQIGHQLKRHKYVIGAFFAPFVLMEVIAVVMKVLPFGSQSFLIVDALHQYLPFFADYQEKLQTAGSIFYSFHGGLGYNFLGLWAYYLASPMNLIIGLFPKTMLNMVLSHLLIVKISLCCFSAAFYFRKKRGKDELSIVAFGMAYGFSAYIVGYGWNIMWLEVMMLLPFILYGMDRLIREKDGKLYCFTLFLSLWCNFYMSFMTCLFLVLWYLLYEHKNVQEFFKNGIRFAGYSLLSGAMAAVLLLPAYLGIMQTSSAKWDFPKELWYTAFGDIFSRHFLGTKPLVMSVDDGNINLYCGILTLMMVIFYLASKEIPKSVRIRRLILLAILFFSFNMPVLGYIWHGFHNQYGIPNRFAYLYIFCMIAMAYDGYVLIAKEGRKHVQKIFVSLGILYVIIGITMYTAKEEISEMTVYLTGGMALMYAVLFLLYGKKILSKKMFSGVLSLIFMAEIAAMAFVGFSENGTVDTDNYFQDTKAVEKIKQSYGKKPGTRMELASGRMLDESIWHTLPCMTMFGSTARGGFVDMMDQLGFYTGVNEYLYEGATPFTNQLFSVGYQLYRPHDTRMTTFVPTETIGNVTVYKNPYKTSMAYGMDRFVETWDYHSMNPFDVQNDLAEKAYDIRGLFQKVTVNPPELNGCTITGDNGLGEYVFKTEMSSPLNMVFHIKIKETREFYVHFDGGQAENTIVERNGEKMLEGRLNGQILYLGKLRKGDDIRIKIQLEKHSEGVVRMKAAYMNSAVMADLYGTMEDQKLHMTKCENARMEGNISMKKNGTLFFSVPYDDGWTAYVDGKETKIKAVGKSFLGVDIREGEHKVVLKYVSPGFWEGLMISAAGVLLFLFLILKPRFKTIRKK